MTDFIPPARLDACLDARKRSVAAIADRRIAHLQVETEKNKKERE